MTPPLIKLDSHDGATFLDPTLVESVSSPYAITRGWHKGKMGRMVGLRSGRTVVIQDSRFNCEMLLTPDQVRQAEPAKVRTPKAAASLPRGRAKRERAVTSD